MSVTTEILDGESGGPVVGLLVGETLWAETDDWRTMVDDVVDTTLFLVTSIELRRNLTGS